VLEKAFGRDAEKDANNMNSLESLASQYLVEEVFGGLAGGRVKFAASGFHAGVR
jgi:hypothetical protein